jgi:NAD(P)-dependent dehydrogenase (short-subunit alcohol dehydrogenase family)
MSNRAAENGSVPLSRLQPRRKAIITGASSGIGKATALRFAADGCDVCLNARRHELLRQVAESLPAGDHLVCPGDYSDPRVVDEIGRAVHRSWSEVDVLVNCAGVFATSDIFDTPIPQWRASLDTMLGGALLMTRMAVPLMPDGGRVIHVTSIHGERVEARASGYAVAKAALNQFCRSLALELAPRRILVNAIAPGFIRTPMSVLPDGTDELASDWFRRNYVDSHHLPLRRPGQPEEIAGVASFLAGPDASYITGQVITVDGGLTITF